MAYKKIEKVSLETAAWSCDVIAEGMRINGQLAYTLQQIDHARHSNGRKRYYFFLRDVILRQLISEGRAKLLGRCNGRLFYQCGSLVVSSLVFQSGTQINDIPEPPSRTIDETLTLPHSMSVLNAALDNCNRTKVGFESLPTPPDRIDVVIQYGKLYCQDDGIIPDQLIGERPKVKHSEPAIDQAISDQFDDQKRNRSNAQRAKKLERDLVNQKEKTIKENAKAGLYREYMHKHYPEESAKLDAIADEMEKAFAIKKKKRKSNQ